MNSRMRRALFPADFPVNSEVRLEEAILTALAAEESELDRACREADEEERVYRTMTEKMRRRHGR